jgi:hypothetical protein
LGFGFLPRHDVLRRGIVLREATVELDFHILAELWLVTLIHESIPEGVHKSDAIHDRPGIDFGEDCMEIHGPSPENLRIQVSSKLESTPFAYHIRRVPEDQKGSSSH